MEPRMDSWLDSKWNHKKKSEVKLGIDLEWNLEDNMINSWYDLTTSDSDFIFITYEGQFVFVTKHISLFTKNLSLLFQPLWSKSKWLPFLITLSLA